MFKMFIRRPVLSIVVSLVIVFIGILSLFSLPITQYPIHLSSKGECGS
jgi:HAE1 family hydrophobic/amphiphilic exporter-1